MVCNETNLLFLVKFEERERLYVKQWLDSELIGEVLDIIKKVADKCYTMILVSHEMDFIKKVSNRVLFLDGGHIIEDVTPEEVFENPKNERTKQFFEKMKILRSPE